MTLIFELLFRLYNRLSIKYELRLYKGQAYEYIYHSSRFRILLGQIKYKWLILSKLFNQIERI